MQERKKMLAQGYTLDQIHEIEQGQRDGLNPALYADRTYFAIQMRQIRLGLMEGLPVELYAKPDYDWFQMEEIRLGLSAGIDVDKYADAEIPYDVMRQVRLGLMEGVDLSAYRKLPAGILRELREAMHSRVNIVKYIKEGYGTEQLKQIRLALEKGVEIDPYLVREFRGPSIGEICAGLERSLDVSLYAKIEYSWQQMREIRLGLESRVDVSQYANSFYGWQQMREIRLGLMEGLPVDIYRSLMYTASDMKRMREKLMRAGQEEENLREPALSASGDEDFEITVSADGMSAYLHINEEGKVPAPEAVRKALADSGITVGILEEEIQKLSDGVPEKKKLVIARGVLPRDGKDGWYEYFFRTGAQLRPKLLPDGSVDYQNTQWFETAGQGQKIAFYHEASAGTSGCTVTGKRIPAKHGKQQNVLAGRGFILLPDKKTYLAVMSGKIELRDGRLEITKMLILDEMTLASGKVDFDGSVYIKGNVGTGTVIKAVGDVYVDGFVEAAVIESGGSVFLRQGMNACGQGTVRAAGDVNGQFFEAARVSAAGSIQANYCLGSVLSAGAKVIIRGRHGILAGGETSAFYGIDVYEAGNRAGLKTVLKVGVTEAVSRGIKNFDRKLEEINSELRILRNGYADLYQKYPPEIRNALPLFLKVESAIYTKEKQYEELLLQKGELEERAERAKEAAAVIHGTLYEGVETEVNGIVWYAREVSNVTVKRAGERIAVFKN